MATFESRDRELYIDSKKVLKAWESFTGWYWFAVEEVGELEGKPVWFGFVQGLENEWGEFAEAELDALIKKGQIWEIPQRNLPISGRRG
ncbi:MAG: hypothetical protein PHS34_08420 [Candidatus Omnitrophica bacterium]|nr:hypothetical protein [Candidatus Nanoarchaeia archaeon]MDD5551269.1 hypothetical protein [Candidatus Omnitrophota bacterium]